MDGVKCTSDVMASGRGNRDVAVWKGWVKTRQQQEDCHAAAAAAACLPPLTPLLHATFQSCGRVALNHNW